MIIKGRSRLPQTIEGLNFYFIPIEKAVELNLVRRPPSWMDKTIACGILLKPKAVYGSVCYIQIIPVSYGEMPYKNFIQWSVYQRIARADLKELGILDLMIPCEVPAYISQYARRIPGTQKTFYQLNNTLREIWNDPQMTLPEICYQPIEEFIF